MFKFPFSIRGRDYSWITLFHFLSEGGVFALPSSSPLANEDVALQGRVKNSITNTDQLQETAPVRSSVAGSAETGPVCQLILDISDNLPLINTSHSRALTGNPAVWLTVPNFINLLYSVLSLSRAKFIPSLGLCSSEWNRWSITAEGPQHFLQGLYTTSPHL